MRFTDREDGSLLFSKGGPEVVIRDVKLISDPNLSVVSPVFKKKKNKSKMVHIVLIHARS